jgi:hypothetical protein
MKQMSDRTPLTPLEPWIASMNGQGDGVSARSAPLIPAHETE